MRRQRPVWLSSIKPQNIVYDAENDDYCDIRWGEQPHPLPRSIEREAVERRMTASNGDIIHHAGTSPLSPVPEDDEPDGSGDDSFYSVDGDCDLAWIAEDGEDDKEEEDMLFFNATSVVSPSSRPSSRPNSVADGVLALSDTMPDDFDFQSCRGSISESMVGGDRYSAGAAKGAAAAQDDDVSPPVPVPLLVPSIDTSNKSPAEEATNENEKGEPEMEKAILSRSAKKLLSMGNHIKGTNVYLFERLSNRTVLGIMTAYYITFCLIIVYGVVSIYKDDQRTTPMAIVPGITSTRTNSSITGGETKYTCFPHPQVNGAGDAVPPMNGTCVPNTAVTVEQAILLANTVVVSDGIAVSDWRGNGALPGSPPFFAQNIMPASSFIIDGSALDYDANPELHTNWDQITAAIWYGHYRGGNETTHEINKATLTWKFQRTDGQPWPPDTADYPMPMNAHLYACTQGANCSSVGNYRQQLLQPAFGPSYDIFPRQKLDPTGSVYEISFDMPNSLLVASDVIQAYGWRFVLHNDPNGAIRSCLLGEHDCIVNTLVESSMSGNQVVKIVDVIFLVLYLTFFLLWIVALLIFSGWPRTWPIEQQWLFVMGIGLSFYNNIYSVGLELAESHKTSYAFSEIHWFASAICSRFGQMIIIGILAVFADSPRHFVAPFSSFYWPKLCYCFVYFLSMVIAILWRFPQLNARDQPGTDTEIGGLGFVTVPITWPTYDKVVVTAATLVTSVCLGLGFLYYIVRCLITQRVLSSLPYNMTRPVQIAFRFFVSATAIWIFAELIMFTLQVLNGIVKTLQYDGFETDSPLFDRVITGLDELRFFSKDDNPATVIFGTIFTIFFQFMFSPPSALGPVRKKETYYATEKEASEAKRKGRLGFRVPSNLMILERARLLVICSREVYLPFKDEWDDQQPERDKADLEAGKRKASPRSPKRSPLADSFVPVDLNPKWKDRARIAGFRYGIRGHPVPKGSAWGAGCRPVAYISEPKGLNVHDTRALLFRHEPSGALILSFRGTLSTKHIKTDLMTHKVMVSLDTFLAIPSKREMARRVLQAIVPDAIEKNLLSGSKQKVSLVDLLHVDGEALPDYLQSSTKSNAEIYGLGFGRLHFGFFSSYNRVRRDIHRSLRDELVSRPAPLYICGHSLGGCLATVCAYDAARWILPTIENDLQKLGRPSEVDRLTLSMYSYGAPRPGDRSFALAYDRFVKDTQRIVCDGDVITSGMPTWMNYAHVGTEDIFDYTGSIRTNPSIVEKATLKNRTSPESHFLTNYAKVIKLARQPDISALELLNLLRDEYGIERIEEEKKKKPKKRRTKKEDNKPPEQPEAAPTKQSKPPLPPPPRPLTEPRSNAFDILYG